MKSSALDYTLPREKIALFPAGKRTDAKLLCVDKKTGACSHRIFRDLPDLLTPTDLLILNDTKVLPARLWGKRVTGGKAEALLLRELGKNIWEVLLKPGGRVREGSNLVFENEEVVLEAEVLDSLIPGSGKRRLRFLGERVAEKIRKLGRVPLPPYIDRPDLPDDREQYQTVFAEKEGAVASPTAGLHFDEALLDRIAGMGVGIAYVTLHVGYGTFQPITSERVEDHRMFEEEYEIPVATARMIGEAKRDGRRVVVCGTTCVRALEAAVAPIASGDARTGTAAETGDAWERGGDVLSMRTGQGKTSIFIYPPYDFKVADALITNFHMPRSTLLAMVAAFLGHDKLMAAYHAALAGDYRFASYGDAMFIY
ncbi:MAG: tRNA preQ1(34) S-adenosylmethionine ribosyltransferase-isomerase QueA [Candidatus Omnitrophica bacterium]|nr:tRNA preQ1(34) S-adenosylmethionine ribosyltransferase-isomerase QueA [Candidatus Omnitrophota bacterium]